MEGQEDWAQDDTLVLQNYFNSKLNWIMLKHSHIIPKKQKIIHLKDIVISIYFSIITLMNNMYYCPLNCFSHKVKKIINL